MDVGDGGDKPGKTSRGKIPGILVRKIRENIREGAN